MVDFAEEEEEKGGEGWLVSYADLMTLLFAAFVVLYGITPQGESKIILGVVSSIRESFVEIPDEPIDESKVQDLFDGKLSFKAVTPETIAEPPVKRFNKEQSELRKIDEHLKRVEVFLQQQSRGKGIQVNLRRATVADLDEFGLNLVFMGDVFFAGEEVSLSPAARNYLRDLGTILKKIDRPLVVEGHTDSRPAAGNRGNDEIAALRAEAVRDLLVNEVGIPNTKVHTASYGGSRPLGELKVKDAKKDNNRVEIKVDYGRLDTGRK